MLALLFTLFCIFLPLHLYLPPFLHPAFQSLTFSFALSSLCYSCDSFHKESCICLLSFILLFCPHICNLISRALLLSFCVLLHLHTQMWSQHSPATHFLISKLLCQSLYCSSNFHSLLNHSSSVIKMYLYCH